MIELNCMCRSASGSVLAKTVVKAAREAPDVNHLWPLMTHSSPSRYARRLHLRRVAAGDLRLGQAHRRELPAGDERGEVALALVVVGVQVQHDRVLHRRRADGDLADLRAADDLVEVHEVHERQPAAADLRRVPERPQAAGLGLGLELGDRPGRRAGWPPSPGPGTPRDVSRPLASAAA